MSPTQVQQTLWKRRQENARVGGWEKDVVRYYGCFMAIALRNSNQLSLLEEDLHRIDPVSLPACPGEKLVWFHSRSGAIGN